MLAFHTDGIADHLNSEAERFAVERDYHGDRQRQNVAGVLAHMKSQFEALGITRLARITGLDTIGIAVWAAIRPNASKLSVTQGKGLTDDTAALSAVMEAFELAIAEQPHPRTVRSSARTLDEMTVARLDLRRYLRKGAAMPAAEAAIDWVVGRDLIQQQPILVPADVIRLYDQQPSTSAHPFWQMSDGFGAGSTLTEAIVHGICERVERDARTLAALQSSETIIASEIVVEKLSSSDLSDVADRIARAGLSLRVFDITSDLNIPTYQAVIAPLGGTKLTFLDLATGTGSHPYAARAALRAVLEATQTRLTAIAGARDDFDPALYRRPLPRDLEIYLETGRGGGRGKAPAVEFDRPGDPAAQLAFLLNRLRQAGITKVIAVSFETEARYGVSLARVIVPQLEDDLGSANWRPGKRALPNLLRL